MTIFSSSDVADQALLTFLYTVTILGTFLCLVVALDILISHKLQFQRERLVFVLMTIQVFSGLFGIFQFLEFFSDAVLETFFECPNIFWHSFLDGGRNAFLVSTAMMELFLISAAIYSMFVGKRELPRSIENVSLAFIVLATVGVTSSFTVGSLNQVCHGSNFSWRADLNMNKVELGLFVGFGLMVWLAYFTFLILWRKQMKLWRKTDLSNVLRRRSQITKKKLIIIEKARVDDVVASLQRYVFAFILSSVGVGLTFFADTCLSENHIFVYVWNTGISLQQLQRLLQALAYITDPSNSKNWCPPKERKAPKTVKRKAARRLTWASGENLDRIKVVERIVVVSSSEESSLLSSDSDSQW
eukprot:m.18211 g.18211  ORF g.18211 m.18211 type:complete len:358 (-) comp6240_c0_seq1:6052-7125(-)